MTEKEKMLKEMLYDANNDEDLLKERTIAKDLCFKFNQLMPSDTVNQKKILHQLLGPIDDSTCIMSPFWCDYGYNCTQTKNSMDIDWLNLHLFILIFCCVHVFHFILGGSDMVAGEWYYFYFPQRPINSFVANNCS